MSKELELLRAKLQSVDEQLVVLLAERSVISREIGRLKIEQGVSIKQPDVWEEMCLKRQMWADHYKVDRQIIHDIFETIHEYSIKEQKNG